MRAGERGVFVSAMVWVFVVVFTKRVLLSLIGVGAGFDLGADGRLQCRLRCWFVTTVDLYLCL